MLVFPAIPTLAFARPLSSNVSLTTQPLLTSHSSDDVLFGAKGGSGRRHHQGPPKHRCQKRGPAERLSKAKREARRRTAAREKRYAETDLRYQQKIDSSALNVTA